MSNIRKKQVARTLKSVHKIHMKNNLILDSEERISLSLEEASKIITNIMRGLYYNPVIIEVKDNAHHVIANGIILKTVIDFMNSEFYFSNNVKFLDQDLSRLKYNELHEEFQDFINDYDMTFVEISGMTDEERELQIIALKPYAF